MSSAPLWYSRADYFFFFFFLRGLLLAVKIETALRTDMLQAATLERIASTAQATLAKARERAERVQLDARRNFEEAALLATARGEAYSEVGRLPARAAPTRGGNGDPFAPGRNAATAGGDPFAPSGNAWPAAREAADELQQTREALGEALADAAQCRAAAAEALGSRDEARGELHACKAELRATSALSAMEVEAAETRLAQFEDEGGGREARLAGQLKQMHGMLAEAEELIREQEGEIDSLIEHISHMEQSELRSRSAAPLPNTTSRSDQPKVPPTVPHAPAVPWNTEVGSHRPVTTQPSTQPSSSAQNSSSPNSSSAQNSSTQLAPFLHPNSAAAQKAALIEQLRLVQAEQLELMRSMGASG